MPAVTVVIFCSPLNLFFFFNKLYLTLNKKNTKWKMSQHSVKGWNYLFTLIGVWTVSRKKKMERMKEREAKMERRKKEREGGQVSNRREKQTGSGAERDKQREQERDRRERRELVFMWHQFAASNPCLGSNNVLMRTYNRPSVASELMFPLRTGTHCRRKHIHQQQWVR